MQNTEREMRSRIEAALKAGTVPEPLIPAGQDVHGFSNLMLDVIRLTSSEFWAKASHVAKASALALWCYAWLQCPAGSLPNDPAVWARVANVPLKRMKAMTAKPGPGSPMHGFILCSDGRWYHPTICADALRVLQTRANKQTAANARWNRDILNRPIGQGTAWQRRQANGNEW